MLSLSLSCRLELVGATNSVFPAVDELLEDVDVQKALKFVSGRKNMDRYRSIVDFLFAELIGGKWKVACFRYYDDEGPRLDDDPRVTIEMLESWERDLIHALKFAEEMYLAELKTSWGWFKKQLTNDGIKLR